MDFTNALITAFEYDRWASRRWLDSLSGFKDVSAAYPIIEHILQAQQIWLTRCGAVIGPQQDDMSLQELFELTTAGWMHLMETSDPDELITYRNSRGEEFTNSIAHIAMHVVNHGTYHRGQLRQMAQDQGYENFPETDLIAFLRE